MYEKIFFCDEYESLYDAMYGEVYDQGYDYSLVLDDTFDDEDSWEDLWGDFDDDSGFEDTILEEIPFVYCPTRGEVGIA